jgi:Carboxypeptidase regulatory-like domain
VSFRRSIIAALSIAGAIVIHSQSIAAQTDVIRGRVIGPDSLPIERATITVTSLTGNVTRTSRTDKNGRYTVTFPGDEGDYFVNVAALGFAGRRFEVKRTGDQEILIADAKLQRVAERLDAVEVKADRQRVGRNEVPDISGSERSASAANVAADQLGDLAALAASLPGVQLIPGADGAPNGFSVLGLTPDQNATTLNGMSFGGSNLPRDANVTTSLVTSPYDVSRGNFSGGLLNVRSRPGSNYIIRSSSLNFDAPQLQWTDPAGRELGQQYHNISAGGLLSGPIQTDKSFFSLAYQAGRRSSDLQSLLNTDGLGLRAVGVAEDSVSRLLNILGPDRVPSTIGGIPGARLADNALVFGTLDWAPPSSTTGQAVNITFNGSWSRQDPSGLSSTELPSHGGERENWYGGIQAKHSGYFGFGVLSETQVGINRLNFYGSPYVDLPNASVRVTSTFTDGTAGVQNLSFGGNPSMDVSMTTTTAQAMNTLSWFSENNKHRLKFTTELRHDEYAQNLTTNALGTFTYNSLSDVAAGLPASFTRQLTPATRSDGQYVLGSSLGDSYRATDDFQLQYGVRLDGNRFSATPEFNPAVEQAFGLRNDYVPDKIYVSPRVGFSWTYGTAPQVAAFQGAVRGPRAVIRGGIGLFQNTPNAQSIGSALDNTGLPSAVQQLTCVGIATPTPNWAAYAASTGNVPTQCADGSQGTVFASTAPNVTLFDKQYSAPKALRSNLQWNGAILNNLFLASVDATYSLNLDQPSTFDVNFDPVRQFALANEGGRPVYASIGGIVPTTGAIAAGEARLDPAFNHVSELRSDMASDARQLTFQLRPSTFSSNYSWSLAYVYANTRDRVRGFSSTDGNPLDASWGRSSFDSRHQIQYGLTYNAFDFIRLSWNGSFRSGTPYTPLVGGDINGDGYQNDRAFIFDPAKTTDSTLAAGMRNLLATGSRSARDCLLSQLNTVAGRNTCQGPWTSTAFLTFSFNPAKVRMPQRANISFQISNPLAAADVVMHGEDHLHGWGQPFIPTSQLLFVRGFDPVTQTYKYDVNPRFGATALSQSSIRAPVTLTALLRVDVGPARERQDLTQLLDRGRTTDGTKAPEALLRAYYGSGGVMNPMAQILRQADTLELEANQADSIAILNRRYTISLDSIWSPVVKYLATLPERYDQDAAYEKYKTAREASVDALIHLAPTVRRLLSDAQMRKLPAFVGPYLDTRYLASVRSGTAGTSLGMIMLPGGGAVPAGGGGGGGVQVIIKSGTP